MIGIAFAGNIGRSNRSPKLLLRRSQTTRGHALPSIISLSRNSTQQNFNPTSLPRNCLSSDGPILISSDYLPHRSKSTPFSATQVPKHFRRLSMNCSLRHTTANAGHGTGSTSLATATAWADLVTTGPSRRPGDTAIGWSMLSMPTCPTTNLFPGRLRGMSLRKIQIRLRPVSLLWGQATLQMVAIPKRRPKPKPRHFQIAWIPFPAPSWDSPRPAPDVTITSLIPLRSRITMPSREFLRTPAPASILWFRRRSWIPIERGRTRSKIKIMPLINSSTTKPND